MRLIFFMQSIISFFSVYIEWNLLFKHIYPSKIIYLQAESKLSYKCGLDYFWWYSGYFYYLVKNKKKKKRKQKYGINHCKSPTGGGVWDKIKQFIPNFCLGYKLFASR